GPARDPLELARRAPEGGTGSGRGPVGHGRAVDLRGTGPGRLTRRVDAGRRLLILTEGKFQYHDAKTAMGVIRYGTDHVVALLDSAIAGRSAAEWMPGY